ncbi:C40 family peptidase [Streptomyces sp. XM83C]|uniref:C40 family peptidase n=1 Tax=Streptomyces sp. XM83C TaxID=2929781 RepID=UPI001FF97A0A|nr:NlpC/P60 family protein [Streptomyces sp. XM83C]MCK1819303.1 C40 family peptidase [Streptomyces sp. XM83C]
MSPLLTGDDAPSQNEVSRRIAALYDRAETDTGTFNATRAQNRRPDGGARERSAAPLSSVTRQWFDVARSKLGPTVPAVLPADRAPARPDTPSRSMPGKSTTSAPALPSGSRSASRELPAASGSAAGALPPASGTPQKALSAAGTPALPESRPSADRAGGGRSEQGVSPAVAKQRTQAKLAACRTLLASATASAGATGTGMAAGAATALSGTSTATSAGLQSDGAGFRADAATVPAAGGTGLATADTAVLPTGLDGLPGSASTDFPGLSSRSLSPTGPSAERAVGIASYLTADPADRTGRFPSATDTGQFPSATDSGRFPSVTDSGQFSTAGITDSGQFSTAGITDSGQFSTAGITDSGQFSTAGITGTGQFPVVTGTGQLGTDATGGTGQFDTGRFATGQFFTGQFTGGQIAMNTGQFSAGEFSTATGQSPAVTGQFAATVGQAASTGQTASTGTGQFALPETLPSAEATVDGKAAPAVAFARAQTGKPCVVGATGPGSYDGPSLVRAAWRAAGVVLPRTAQDQALAGSPVSPAAARPGDLVFFHDAADHVGLCTGAGTVVHAPGPGAYIREESLAEAGPVDGVVRPS